MTTMTVFSVFHMWCDQCLWNFPFPRGWWINFQFQQKKIFL